MPATRRAAAVAAAVAGVESLESRMLLTILAPELHLSVPAVAAPDLIRCAASGADVAPAAGSTTPFGLTPSQIRKAYGIDQVTFGGVTGDGTGQTIAIIDAWDNPYIESDLQTFDQQFSLPAPPSFTRVAQDGSSNLPSTPPKTAQVDESLWASETAADVEWAHAVAPKANILLIEAQSSSFSDMIEKAAAYASKQPGVVAVSMSFSGYEAGLNGNTYMDSVFITPPGHSGVVFLAATGDYGAGAMFPGTSPNVVAVGGTNLTVNGSDNWSTETGWYKSTGGISTLFSKPSYQSAVTKSASYRTTPDVSLNAGTGMAVCDSYANGTSAPWAAYTGTSLACPCWAAMVAIADQGRGLAGLTPLDGARQLLPRLYSLPASNFHDITSGTNYNPATGLTYSAGTGYDLLTGIGTPFANLLVPNIALGGPQVIRSATSGPFPATVSAIDVYFDTPIDPASFSIAADISSFTGPGGVDLRSQITAATWTNTQTLHITFAAQTADGSYSLALGPQILSATGGLAMDQNNNGTPGEAGDGYTATFTVTHSTSPDNYGYKAYAYPFESLGLTPGAAGVTTVLDGVDDTSQPLDLGTNTFNFYGTTYTGANSLYVADNGFLTFTSYPSSSNSNPWENTQLTSYPTQATIAAAWDDWLALLNSSDQVLRRFDDLDGDGIADRLVIEWHQVEDSPAETMDPATFQVILQLNTGSKPGDIIFNYPDLYVSNPNFDDGGSATVGIKAAGTQGSNRLLIAYNQVGGTPLVGTGKAIRISTTANPSVAGRYAFYNNSKFDGNNAAANAADDAAIATDKTALLPGQTASFVNYTSSVLGLNGVMLDIAGLPKGPLSASDFTIAVGNSSTPAAWTTGTTQPSSVTVRRGAGVGGSDRVTLIWADRLMTNRWVQVTVKSNSDTGLTFPDVFYFGNQVGDTGNSASNAVVDSADYNLVAANPTNFLNPATVANPYDFNRDSFVDATDLVIARDAATNPLGFLQLISVPSNYFAAQPQVIAAPVTTAPAPPASRGRTTTTTTTAARTSTAPAVTVTTTTSLQGATPAASLLDTQRQASLLQ